METVTVPSQRNSIIAITIYVYSVTIAFIHTYGIDDYKRSYTIIIRISLSTGSITAFSIITFSSALWYTWPCPIPRAAITG